ncbi:MAG: TonB-dependent receptor plug [Puniceicoccaceae bacterium 5H]|nr:MAG: TonB-dependent receptor plug [Puniceicoccaceae bacterium 5H]
MLALPALSYSMLTAQDNESESNEVFELPPFSVTTDEDIGYMAANTLSGTRLRTDLKDVGSAVSVYTEEFLNDVGATDSQSLLTYAVGVEVGGTFSTYTEGGGGSTIDEGARLPNPNTSTRVRGLAAADNARDYFISRIPWDGFNIARVDINRGANSILFGLGSPAGIINYTVIEPQFNDLGKISARVGSYGSTRMELDLNKELIDNELAVRFAAVSDKEKFRQDPAYEDDQRWFGAIKYQPDWFKNLGGVTQIKANVERGDVTANRPRTVTPVDYITPWFNDPLSDAELEQIANATSIDDLPRPLNQLMGLGQQTYTPFQLEDDYSELPNRGQRRATYTSGDPNPYYNPAIGNFAQVFGGPIAIFPDHTSGEVSRYYMSEMHNVRGIGEDGEIDGGVGFPYNRLGGVAEYRNFATQIGLPYAEYGQYKNFHLQDPSIFNFYDNLIDGPNKQEKQDWTAYNLSLAQTFFNNKIGFELSYDSQDYYEERWSMLADQRVALYIDINSELSDGNPNPNAGRPFVSDNGQYGTYSLDESRDVMRATAFGEFEFNDVMEDGWLTKLLGRHVITGLFTRDEFENDRRSWLLYGTDAAYDSYVSAEGEYFNGNDNVRLPNAVVYLGDALYDRSTASGAHVPNPSAWMTMGSGQLYNFDSTWNATGVDPAAYWQNTWNGDDSTQSENPANYVGWSNYDFTPLYSERDGRTDLTTSADLTERQIDSKAGVWQGYFWDGAVVTTLGYREDTVKTRGFRPAYRYDEETGDVDEPWLNQIRDVRSETYTLDGAEWDPSITDDSLTKGVVVHINDLLNGALPINVSLSYLDSENFNPSQARTNIYGEAIPFQSGGTEDYGLWLSTKDNRFSFRVTKFETTLQNASSTAITGNWFLGAVMAWGGNWANVFEYNIDGNGNTFPDDTEPGRYNYSPAAGETQEQAAAREQAAIAGFRALQDAVDPRYWDAWSLDKNATGQNQAASAPQNFSITEDSVSEGYEFEFVANPVPNWRVSLTASKTEATRYNVGGTALVDFVETVDTALNETPAGDLRIWWGGAGNTTTLREWNANFMGNYNLKKLQEGTSTPDIRQWRFTLVSNYSFDEGFLEGFNVGGSYRWEDEVAIGYPLMEDADGNITYDIDSPYYGPSEDFIDLWVGYKRMLTDSIEWSIQVNVRNAFEDEGLIPISVQPDGKTWAAVRTKPEQTWFVTNTFSF